MISSGSCSVISNPSASEIMLSLFRKLLNRWIGYWIVLSLCIGYGWVHHSFTLLSIRFFSTKEEFPSLNCICMHIILFITWYNYYNIWYTFSWICSIVAIVSAFSVSKSNSFLESTHSVNCWCITRECKQCPLIILHRTSDVKGITTRLKNE